MEVADHFNIPALACINKYDINEENTENIMRFCEEKGVKVVGTIPYDDTATKAMMAGKTVVEFTKSGIAKNLTDIWKKVLDALEKEV